MIPQDLAEKIYNEVYGEESFANANQEILIEEIDFFVSQPLDLAVKKMMDLGYGPRHYVDQEDPTYEQECRNDVEKIKLIHKQLTAPAASSEKSQNNYVVQDGCHNCIRCYRAPENRSDWDGYLCDQESRPSGSIRPLTKVAGAGKCSNWERKPL